MEIDIQFDCATMRGGHEGTNRVSAAGDDKRGQAGPQKPALSKTLPPVPKAVARGQMYRRNNRSALKEEMVTEPISPPRALQKGEFYCHACEQYVLLTDHDKHKKLHLTMAWKPGSVK